MLQARLSAIEPEATSVRTYVLSRCWRSPPQEFQTFLKPTLVPRLDFPNLLGMAAGFDKNAEVPGPLLRLVGMSGRRAYVSRSMRAGVSTSIASMSRRETPRSTRVGTAQSRTLE